MENGKLVLQRFEGQTIRVRHKGETLLVTLEQIRPLAKAARISFQGPRAFDVWRSEIQPKAVAP